MIGRGSVYERRPDGLLIGAAIVCVMAGLLAVFLNERSQPFFSSLEFRAGVVYGAILAGIWLSMRVAGYKGDQFLLPVMAMLGGLGLVMAIRLQPDLIDFRGFQIAIGERQLAYLVVGLLLVWGVACFFPDPRFLSNLRYTILFAGIALLGVTAVVGTQVNGARLWLTLGGVQIQTAELVKVALVIFLASFLAENQQTIGAGWRVGRFDLPPLPYLAPMLLMWGLCIATLVALNDLGTALLFFLLFLVMLFSASGRASNVVLGLIVFLVGAFVAYLLFDRVQGRIENWIDPWKNPFGIGYQQIQADYAIASGGLVGTGPGRGESWLIPEVQTDYIAAAVGEEWGLLGIVTLLALYGILTARGFLIARQTESEFLKLLAIGLTSSLVIQAVVILAGVLRLLPLTGVTTPFVSYGGSSLIVSCLIVGLLLRISTASRSHPVHSSRRRLRIKLARTP